MPWKCSNDHLIPLDDLQICPECGQAKTAWSVVLDQTRTLVLAKRKKLECRRGQSVATSDGAPNLHVGVSWHPTEEAAVLSKAAARERMDRGLLPDANDILCVRMHPPKKAKRWGLSLAVNFEKKAILEHAFEFEQEPDRLGDEGYFAAHFVCVHGPEEAGDLAFPFVHVLDVTDATELGHAPQLTVEGVRLGKPIPIRLAKPAAPKALECRRGETLPTGAASPFFHEGVSWHVTDAASVLSKAEARTLRDDRLMPDAHDVLCVRMAPGERPAWRLTLTIQFSSKPHESVELEFTRDPGKLGDEGHFAAHFVCVHGAEDVGGLRFPFLEVLDVSEETALGHAPLLEVTGLGSEPIPIRLGEQPVPPLVPPQLATHFVEATYQLRDGTPLAGAPYVVTTPAGDRREGSLNAQGSLREEGLRSRTCRVEVDPEILELQLHDGLSNPVRSTPFKLVVGERTLEGTTDAAGWLAKVLPQGTQEVTVRYTPPGSRGELELKVVVDSDRERTDAFYLAQLRNLGFTDEADDRTILRFQARRHLKTTGKLDAATKAAIDEIVDGDDDAVKTHLAKQDA